MKLALDNQIGNKVAKMLSKHHDIVIRAHDLPDHIWLTEALNSGADFIISPDLDIAVFICREQSDAIWIELPQGLGGEKQYNFIMKKIEEACNVRISA